MVQILCRRTKNNPCLIGDAGVGKTGLGFAAAASPDEFLAVMDHYGIDESLVYDLTDLETARLDDPSEILAFCSPIRVQIRPSTPASLAIVSLRLIVYTGACRPECQRRSIQRPGCSSNSASAGQSIAWMTAP